MKRALFLAAFASSSALSFAQALAQEAAGAAPAAAGRSIGLDEIVVTAQRREESLQNVPVAVTAINSDALDAARVSNIRSLAALAPNLQVTSQGQQNTPNISIRGVSSGTSTNSVDPKVGIYVDGVYVGRSVGAIFDMSDIERIEVLRGPQGTLFGRNATAGAMSIVTSAPTGELGVKQTLSYGNLDAFRSRTILNLPAFGPLSIKLSYLHDEIDGDVKNSVGGRTIDLRLRAPEYKVMRYADTLGGRNVDAVQAAARFEAADSLTVDYRFDYSDSKSVGRGAQLLGVPADSSGSLLSGILAFQGLTGGISNLSAKRLGTIASANTVEHLTVQGHNLTITWEQSDAVTVKSITGYRKFNQRPSVYDLAASGGLRFTASQLGVLLSPSIPPANKGAIIAGLPIGPNDSFFSLVTSRTMQQKQFSEEAQITVTQDSFNLVAGAFYFHERAPELNVLGIFQPVANGVALVIPSYDLIFGSGTTRSLAINDSLAFYGQGTYHLSDTLDITGGLRYTFDDRETRITEISAAQGGALSPGIYKAEYNKLTYAGIVTWKPNPQLTTYAKISTGYVAGGVMNGRAYKPESLIAYEIGLKSQWFDNRLRANFAAFYSDYTDIQTQNFINGVQFFTNAGKAEIPGAELEIDARPSEFLTLGGSVGYSDFKYKELFLNGADVAKISLPSYFSKWTARVYGQVDLPEFAGGGRPFARFDARWRSDSKLVAQRYANPSLEKLATTKAYWLVDGSLGVADLPVGGGTVKASLYGQNIFNKRYHSFGAPVIGLTGIYDRGRTYGAELAFNF